MSYQRDRDTFIATVTREGLPLWVAERLLREATGFQRRAELACSSEAADRDRVPCPAMPNNKRPCLCDASPFDAQRGEHQTIPRITLQDWRAERRCTKLLEPGTIQQVGWQVLTAGDPRGYTLRVIPPSYASRNSGKSRDNWESIGVPARDSRLRF